MEQQVPYDRLLRLYGGSQAGQGTSHHHCHSFAADFHILELGMAQAGPRMGSTCSGLSKCRVMLPAALQAAVSRGEAELDAAGLASALLHFILITSFTVWSHSSGALQDKVIFI